MQIEFGRYIMDSVMACEEGSKLVARAFDEFLINDREIPGSTKLQIAYFFEKVFKSLAEGQQ